MVLQKLANSPVSTQTAYRIKKLIDKVDTAMKKIADDYKATIGKTFGELDEKGEIVPEGNPHGFKLKEGVSQEELLKAVEEFGKTPVEIDRLPLFISDLNEVKMSARDLSSLDIFLQDPETGEPAPVTQLNSKRS